MTNPITALSRAELNGLASGLYKPADATVTVAQLARALLAVMDAKPYGYVHKNLYETCGGAGLSSDHEAYVNSTSHIPLYTTPPAPSAPDGWIKCSDRMPSDSTTVTFYLSDDKSVKQGRFIMGGWHQEQDWCQSAYGGHIDSEVVGEVTHWMPLPAAPQQ